MFQPAHLTRTLLLTGTVLTSIAFAAPAFAQDTTTQTTTTTTDATTPPAAAADDNTTVVITGSRIRHTEYNSAAPVQIITSEKSSLSGMISATDVLQNSSIAAGAGQVNNTFTGYVINGGDGTNSISLRGLGEQRSLVLINGRRMPPAGISGTVAAVDLNFIPQSIVQRYEILKDGASSIYGSDAVAGVVNIITVKNFDGFHIENSDLVSEKKGGESYSVSAMGGKTFDKGSFLVTGEYYEQKPLLYSQRQGLACPNTIYYNADGSRGDRIDPKTGKFKCYASTGVLQGLLIDNITGDEYFYTPGARNADAPDNYTRYDGTLATALLEDDNPSEALDTTAISPVKRMSLFAEGHYRPDWLKNGELYTELMFGRRDSTQHEYGELFPYFSDEAPSNPLGQIYAQPVVLFPADKEQKVDFTRVLGGARGNWGSWQWDGSLSYSKSHGQYSNTAVYADRISAGTGIDQITGEPIDVCGADAPAGCVPLDLFSEDAMTRGKLTDAEKAYFFTIDKGVTDYEQAIAEFTATGDIMQLPAGALGGAFGVSYRTDKLDDLPGELSRSGNSYNQSSAGETKGSDDLAEAFGELEIPLLKGAPFFESFTVDLSGRFSNYKSVGSATTYKAGFDWAVDNILRFRGTAGTSFRAPALYELDLNGQTSYLSQTFVDPCIRYDELDPEGKPKVSATVKANCAADGIPGDYDAAGTSSAVLTTSGDKNLKPETSYATTIGFVLTPPNLDFKLAVDFWRIKINNQIASAGLASVGSCYASVAFRSAPGYCDSFERDLDPGSSTYLQILTVDDTFHNVPTQSTAGIDFTVNYEHTFNLGTLTSDAQFSYYKFDRLTSFAGGITDDYTGLIGQPKWVGNIQTKFAHKDWTVAWTANYVGDASNLGFYGETGLASANRHYAASVPPFVTHDLDLRYRAKTFELIVGVNNLFDKYAPEIGSGNFAGSAGRLGNYPFSSQYQPGYLGRQWYVNISKDF